MEKADMILKKLAEGFSSLENCSALAVSGSRTSAIHDDASDWDIYIYSSTRIDPAVRKKILSSLTDDYRICSSFFEEGDDFTAEGIFFDLMYRDTGFVHEQIRRVWTDHTPSLGYTTCFLHNISTSEILFDRNGWFKRIQDEINSGYPEELRTNIISKNARVINGSGASTFMIQAELAKKRHDIVSSNHRLTAILSSYFDILFAYNRTYHPGEKKLLQYAHLLKDFPPDMDEDIERAIHTVAKDGHIKALKTLIGHLYDFLQS